MAGTALFMCFLQLNNAKSDCWNHVKGREVPVTTAPVPEVAKASTSPHSAKRLRLAACGPGLRLAAAGQGAIDGMTSVRTGGFARCRPAALAS